MDILSSAYRHGVDAADIHHAHLNAIRFIEYAYHGEERLLIIGPDRSGALLELIAVPTDSPNRIIHADHLRPSLHEYLR